MTETPSFFVRGIAASGALRVVAVEATALVAEAKARHALSHTATAALGRSLVGALLLSQVLGKHEKSRVALRFDGDGPLGYLVAEAGDSGDVRGYVRHPSAELPPRLRDRKLDVSGLIGAGELAVTRLLENGEPYTGTVALQTAEVAEDIAYYLAASEQIPSALLLGVYLEGGTVRRAGGLLVQAMPDAPEAVLAELEGAVRSFGTLTDALATLDITQATQKLLAQLEPELGAAQPARFACRCSEQKALDSLKFFSQAEQQDMAQQGGQEVVCHWCNTHYQITPAQILALMPSGGAQA